MQDVQEMWAWSLAWEDPLEHEMATCSNILAWKFSRTEEPGSHSPWGHKESDTSERVCTHTHTHTHFSIQQRQIIDAIGYIGAGRKLCNQVSPFYKWRNWGSIRWREWKHENRTGFMGWTACEHDSELGLRRKTDSEASNWKHSFFLSCFFLGI